VDVRTFKHKKLRNFAKLMVCPHGQGGGGLSQCGHFEDKGEGRSIFRDFLRTSFMDGPYIDKKIPIPQQFYPSNISNNF